MLVLYVEPLSDARTMLAGFFSILSKKLERVLDKPQLIFGGLREGGR